MEDRDASFLYNWVVRIVLLVGIFVGSQFNFRNFDVSRQLYLVTFSLSGVVVILALVVMIWQSRKRVTQAILAEDADQGTTGQVHCGLDLPGTGIFLPCFSFW